MIVRHLNEVHLAIVVDLIDANDRPHSPLTSNQHRARYHRIRVDRIAQQGPPAALVVLSVQVQRLLRPARDVLMPGQLAEWRITDNGWLQMHRDPEHAGHSLFNLAVDDLDACVTSLRNRSYEPSDPTDVNNGVRISSVVDPDGNTITLIGNFREDY